MIVIALSGCIMGDELYLTSKEQYAIGWILHDINDSTSTNLTYSLNDLAIYNYSYHYPSSMPDTYYNFFTLLSPVPNGMTEETIIFGNQLAVPLNRTYYTMGINPAQENYKTYWSFFNVMRINYLPDVDPYSDAHMEYLNSIRGYRAIKPETGDRSLVYFGKAPFTPTQILIENSSIKLKNYLVRGYHSDSYLWRNTGDFPDYLMPKYQIFLNGSLNSSGNLTDVNKIWNYTSLNYSLVENGTYTVNMTIPTSYEVLVRIEIGATF